MGKRAFIRWGMACALGPLMWFGCKSEPQTPPSAPIVPSTPTYEQIAALFGYDASAPLDVTVSAEEVRDGYALITLSYAGRQGVRVPAYLLVPDGPGPFAGMIYLHWGGAYPNPPADKDEFLAEAGGMARLKTVCLLIDAPFARPSYAIGCEMYIQTVIDLRRGVDLLRARPDVDGARLGYVGHSFGATWGGVLPASTRGSRPLS